MVCYWSLQGQWFYFFKGDKMRVFLFCALVFVESTSFGGQTTSTSPSFNINRVLAAGHNAAVDYLITGQMTPSLATAIDAVRGLKSEFETASDESIIEALIKQTATDVRLK
jgi:hypothetical protein